MPCRCSTSAFRYTLVQQCRLLLICRVVTMAA
ncbi:hypothetical protein FOXYSP1_00858 [Fusarium oxysporum f. sp. phaseoli]